MSLEQLKAFVAKVKCDSNLQEKLKAVKTPDAIVAIAKEHGHEFTADKLTELSDEDLKSLAGGEDESFVAEELGYMDSSMDPSEQRGNPSW